MDERNENSAVALIITVCPLNLNYSTCPPQIQGHKDAEVSDEATNSIAYPFTLTIYL